MITAHSNEPRGMLVVVDEPDRFSYLIEALDKRGLGFGLASEYEGAWDLLDHHDFVAAIVRLPGESIKLYEELRANRFTMPFILLSEDEPIARPDPHFCSVGYPFYPREIFAALRRLGVRQQR